MRASPPGEDHIMTAMSARSKSGYDLGPLPAPERERLARDLSAEERRVLLDHGTEPPFCGGLLNNKEAGVYTCRLCGLPLFRAGTEFEFVGNSGRLPEAERLGEQTDKIGLVSQR